MNRFLRTASAIVLALAGAIISISRVYAAETRRKTSNPMVKNLRVVSETRRIVSVLWLSRMTHHKVRTKGNLIYIDIEAGIDPKIKKKYREIDDGRIIDIRLISYGRSSLVLIQLAGPVTSMRYKVMRKTKPPRIIISVQEQDSGAKVIPSPIAKPDQVAKEASSSGDPDYLILSPPAAEIEEDATEHLSSRRLGYFRYIPKFSGYLRNESAKRLNEPGNFTKVRNTLMLDATGALREGVAYKIAGRFYYDAIYALESRYPDAVKHDQRDEASLRYAYLDISLGSWEMRLGKQQIVWGEALGLFFADFVNAKDLREFVLPEFEDIRIPQWATELGYTYGDINATLIWQPILEFNKLGLVGSEFSFPLPLLPNRLPQARPLEKPPNTLENSELGGRLSYYVGGWDASLLYLYSWEKNPILFRSLGPFSQTFFPEHRRLHIGGATITKELAEIVFTGEAVYTKDKYFSVLDELDADGVVQKDIANYVVGATILLWGQLNTNLQIMEKRIFDYEGQIFKESKLQTMASLWLKMGFFDDRLEPECFFQTDVRKKDKVIRPKLNYKFGDRWRAYFGADLFVGKPLGLFGQFTDKDRMYLGVRYDF